MEEYCWNCVYWNSKNHYCESNIGCVLKQQINIKYEN